MNNPPSQEEDSDEKLEASGNCLVNRNYVPPWLSTPFPDSHVSHVSHVSLIKIDPFRIYNRDTGELLGIRHSTDTTDRPQVDTATAAGSQTKQDDVTNPTPGDTE